MIPPGYEAIYCVDDSPEAIKSRMTSLEDADRLGRLFDIDVLRTDGTRFPERNWDMPPAPACSAENQLMYAAAAEDIL